MGLLRTQNPWRPGLIYDGSTHLEDKLIHEIQRKTLGILNKMTVKNFEKLVDRLLKLKLEEVVEEAEYNPRNDLEHKGEAEAITSKRISAVIFIIFDKATSDDKRFTAVYAQMVHRIYTRASAVISKIFRKKLLDQCQKDFEQGSCIEEEVKVLEEKLAAVPVDLKPLILADLEDKRFTARRRRLGNVRFIGELFNLQILTPKIMIECVNMLIGNGDEESLECLCVLLTTAGQKLETDTCIVEFNDNANAKTTKRRLPNKWYPDPNFIANTFVKLYEISEDKRVSPRIRFALLDVYEFRALGWTPICTAQREELEGKKQLTFHNNQDRRELDQGHNCRLSSKPK